MLVGYHAVFDKDYHDAIAYASDSRFDYVQFDLNIPRFYLDHLSAREVRRIRTAADDRHVGLSVHAPGDNVSLFTDYPAARDGLLRQMQHILHRANDLGARHLTVHPGLVPSFRRARETGDAYRAEYAPYYRRVLSENLRWMADRSGSVVICVENFGTVDLAFEALGGLLGQGFPIHLCWDFAKSAAQNGAEDFFRQNAGHIREVHVHDLDLHGRSHQVVGEGTLDFRRYAEVIVRGDVATTIEVRPREAALESRLRLSQILAAHRESEPE